MRSVGRCPGHYISLFLVVRQTFFLVDVIRIVIVRLSSVTKNVKIIFDMHHPVLSEKRFLLGLGGFFYDVPVPNEVSARFLFPHLFKFVNLLLFTFKVTKNRISIILSTLFFSFLPSVSLFTKEERCVSDRKNAQSLEAHVQDFVLYLGFCVCFFLVQALFPFKMLVCLVSHSFHCVFLKMCMHVRHIHLTTFLCVLILILILGVYWVQQPNSVLFYFWGGFLCYSFRHVCVL